jgi:putative spermidine/putrescine transport system ATP-binding protein
VTHSQEEALALADLVIVMNGGRIEQIASARTVFDRPATIFVARFVGGHNVFGCTVEAADANGARLRGARGVAIETTQRGLTPGSSVHVAIRSDRMRMSRAAQRLRVIGADGIDVAPTAMPSRVAAIEYQGGAVKVRLDADWGEELTVLMPDRSFYEAPVAEGDIVTIEWADSDVHVVN